MRLSYLGGLLALSLVVASCIEPGLTEQDVEELEEEADRLLRSVAGPWIGVATILTLDFQLQEASGNVVSGTGTMKEAAAAGTVPIVVSGTFRRPQLSLTIQGVFFEGRSVNATIQGSYASVAGIVAPLQLRAEGYSRDVEILLQER